MQNRMALPSLFLLALIFIFSWHCGSDGGGVDVKQLVPVSGGTITASDGLKVTFPPGALDQDTTIEIKSTAVPVDGVTVASAAYQFGPSGLTFKVPVTVSFPLKDGEKSGLVLFWSGIGSTTQFDTIQGAVEGGAYVAQVQHFSIGFIGVGSAPVDGGSDAGHDAGMDAGFDSGFDAGRDAGTDSGFDSGFDAGHDAGTDAGFDSGFDAGHDAGTDAGFDSGFDAGFDAGADAGFDSGFDAGFDAGADAGQDGGSGDGGAACNSVVNTATQVGISKGTGTAPAGTGGTVSNGTYHLSEMVAFPSSPIYDSTFKLRQTAVVENQTMNATADDTNKPPFTTTATLSFPGGNQVSIQTVCTTEVDHYEIPYDTYTATGTDLTFFCSSLQFYARFSK